MLGLEDGLRRGEEAHHCIQHVKVEELHSRDFSGSVGLHGPQTEVKVGEHSLAAGEA